MRRRLSPIAIGLLAIFVTAHDVPARGPASPRFEAASVYLISECGHSIPDEVHGGRGGGAGRSGHLEVCGSLVNMLGIAYGMPFDRRAPPDVHGGPAWTSTALFQVTARAMPGTTADLLAGPMLRALLEERFGLAVHVTPATITIDQVGGLSVADRPGRSNFA